MNFNIIIFVFIFALTCQTHALKILAIASMPLNSHYMALRPFFHELANRGHNVTVINNFPDKNPPPNLRYVNVRAEMNNTTPLLEFYETLDSRSSRWYNFMRHITFGVKNLKVDCENLFTSAEVVSHLSERTSYDVIFVEQFMSDCGLSYAAALYSAPIIGITSHVLLPFAYGRLALPFHAGADAFYFSNAGVRPSLLHKVETYLASALFTTLGRWYIHRSIYEAFDRFLPAHSLDIERDASARLKMMFSYQHFSVTGARPLSPQILEIAGIHVTQPKPVAKEVEEFLSDADQGAIYVSFGTNLKASTMSTKKREQFLTAFKRLPYKVIWKYENATFSDKKLMTGKWFSQLDILCHPKILAFVSHGGMLGLSESAHCGKPLLAIPFFGDQFSNAAAIRNVGLGNTLFFDELDADNLEAAIRELTSEEMQQNAQRISRLWHDRPMPVMDSAIYWTEYVARHKTSPPPLPAVHLSWFENTLLDVYAVLLVVILILGYLIYVILKLVLYVLRTILGLNGKKKVKGE